MDSFREAEEARFEKEMRALRTYHPGRPGISHLMPQLLRSNVFSVGQPRGNVDSMYSVHRHDSLDAYAEGQEVRYQGPQLGQLHKRVVLGLLLLAAGKDGDVRLRFTADALLQSIGRRVCTGNVRQLRRVLEELRRGTFTVTRYEGDSGSVFGLISEVEWVKRDFIVTMSRRFASALETLGRTYIPMSARNQLADGLQTALADLIWSTRCSMIQVADLALLWRREPVQLGREISKCLRRLEKVGIITSSQRRRGLFHFEKSSKPLLEASRVKVKSTT